MRVLVQGGILPPDLVRKIEEQFKADTGQELELCQIPGGVPADYPAPVPQLTAEGHSVPEKQSFPRSPRFLEKGRRR